MFCSQKHSSFCFEFWVVAFDFEVVWCHVCAWLVWGHKLHGRQRPLTIERVFLCILCPWGTSWPIVVNCEKWRSVELYRHMLLSLARYNLVIQLLRPWWGSIFLCLLVDTKRFLVGSKSLLFGTLLWWMCSTVAARFSCSQCTTKINWKYLDKCSVFSLAGWVDIIAGCLENYMTWSTLKRPVSTGRARQTRSTSLSWHHHWWQSFFVLLSHSYFIM